MIKTFQNEFKSLNSSLVYFYPKVGIIDVDTSRVMISLII